MKTRLTRIPVCALGGGAARRCAAALLALAAPWALAQDYPNHPVRIIVPFAAGGPADIYARFIAMRLQESLKQPFIVEDKPGPGTPYHMAGELFKAMAGVSIFHIPYRGSSGARTDVLGGQVDMMFDAVPTMSEHIRAGKVKAMGTTGSTRSAVMPEMPTVAAVSYTHLTL